MRAGHCPVSGTLAEVAEPERADGQVLVEVPAAGVTFPDVLLSRGEYQWKPDPPFVPGSELAGVVREAPDGAAVWPGDRVAAFTGLGGFDSLRSLAPEGRLLVVGFTGGEIPTVKVNRLSLNNIDVAGVAWGASDE